MKDGLSLAYHDVTDFTYCGFCSLQGACVFVAILIHYLYLVAFDWMLLEGFCLYQKVVQVFNVVTRTSVFYIFAWGEQNC